MSSKCVIDEERSVCGVFFATGVDVVSDLPDKSKVGVVSHSLWDRKDNPTTVSSFSRLLPKRRDDPLLLVRGGTSRSFLLHFLRLLYLQWYQVGVPLGENWGLTVFLSLVSNSQTLTLT